MRFILILSLVLFYSLPAQAGQQQTETDKWCSATMREWPRLQMSTAERELRFRTLLKASSKMFRPHASEANEKKCAGLLNQLESLDGVTVLKPQLVVPVTTSGLHINDNRKPVDEAVYTGKCSNLDINRIYNDRKSPIQDSSFSGLPRAEKEKTAVGYSEATRNIEIYDFSKYLGDGTKGYFGEGLIEHVTKGHNWASDCKDTLFGEEALGRIFNSKTCEASRPSKISATLTSATLSSNSSYDHHFTTASFYAYVDISGKLYRVMYSSASDMGSLYQIEHPYSAVVQIDAISNITDGATRKNNTCRFVSGYYSGE